MVEFDDLPDDVFENREYKPPGGEEVRLALRHAAVERGRRLGAHEATMRGERGQEAESRIRRSMAYAAWEFDGKPADAGPYREEFNTLVWSVQPPRLHGGPDSKPGKKQ